MLANGHSLRRRSDGLGTCRRIARRHPASDVQLSRNESPCPQRSHLILQRRRGKPVRHQHPGGGSERAQRRDGRHQVEEETRIYRTGESWSEPPGAIHSISRNTSKTEPAKLLAVFVLDTNDNPLTTPIK